MATALFNTENFSTPRGVILIPASESSAYIPTWGNRNDNIIEAFRGYVEAELELFSTANTESKSGWRSDVSTQQSHRLSAQYTRAPLASGVSVTDHAYENPAQFSCSVLLTDIPPAITSVQSAAASAISAAAASLDVDTIVAALRERFAPGIQASRALRQYDKLVGYLRGFVELTVITSTTYYPVAVMTGLSSTRSPGDGNAIRVDMQFQEIIRPPELLYRQVQSREGSTAEGFRKQTLASDPSTEESGVSDAFDRLRRPA